MKSKYLVVISSTMSSPKVVFQSGVDPFQWNGSYLGTIPSKDLIEEESVEIGRVFRVFNLFVNGYNAKVLSKTIESLLPVIFDELKPIFLLPKIGCHTFRYEGKLMIGYLPIILPNQELYPDLVVANADLHLQKQLRLEIQLTLAFREVFGITDTFDKSLVIRYYNPYVDTNPIVLSFLEPGSVVKEEDGLRSIISQVLVSKWFSENTISDCIARLVCLNRESPQITVAYYQPLIEDVITRIDPNLITYRDLFIQRLSLYIS